MYARASVQSSACTSGVNSASAASSPWLQALSNPVMRRDEAVISLSSCLASILRVGMAESAKDAKPSTANRRVRSERPFPLVTNERLPVAEPHAVARICEIHRPGYSRHLRVSESDSFTRARNRLPAVTIRTPLDRGMVDGRHSAMTTWRRQTVAGVLVSCAVALTAQPGAQAPYTIAYASFGPLNTAVFVANADGTQERMLVGNPALDSNPSFTPDGRAVLFTSTRDGSADIYRIQLDGTNLERLTDDPAFDDQAVMSPDGRASRSSRREQARRTSGCSTCARGGFATSPTIPGGDYRPAWSPDGQWIAFTTDRDSAGARESTGAQFAPRQMTQIYIMRADGSGLRRLTNGEEPVGGASWSPDGTAIVFYEAATEDWQVLSRTFPGVVARSQIATIHVATGARTALTTGPGRKLTPQWIALGRIAYVRADTEEQPGQQKRSRAYWSEGIRFTDGTAGPTGVFTSVHWSADGTRMVYHRDVDETFPPFVRAFSRDPEFQLVRTGFFPSYSPDGRRLASTTPASGRVRTWLYIADADGSNPRVLFNDPAQSALAPAWAPNGRSHRLRTRRLFSCASTVCAGADRRDQF